MTYERSYEHKTKTNTTGTKKSNSGKFSLFRGRASSSTQTDVKASQVDATYSSKYSYSAEGASIMRTKIVPVPPPSVLEDRIRGFMETEQEQRRARIEAKKSPPVTPPSSG